MSQEKLLDAIFDFAEEEDLKVVDTSVNESEIITEVKINFKKKLITIKQD